MEEKRSERDEVREKRLDRDIFFIYKKNKSYIISKSYFYKKTQDLLYTNITSIRIYKLYIGDYLYFLHFLYICFFNF